MKTIRVRFAPSPTGPLHIGGVRTALFNYLFAKKHNGTFILRVEDTDQKRYVPEAEEYILESFKWLGIEPDEGVGKGGDYGPYRQSERKDTYKTYVDQLVKTGKAYYAFDTEEELEALRQQDKTFLYNAHHRQKLKNSEALGQEETQKLLDQKVPYVIRFKVPSEQLVVEDLIRGQITVDTSNIDDKVLLKRDGMPTYHMANIVDDRLMEISHVIRGEEWLASLPFHTLLYNAFGWEPPQFVHLPLILKPNGKGKLSKRDGEMLGIPVFPLQWNTPEGSLQGYREQGFLPKALVNLLALIGWNPGEDKELFYDQKELISAFSFKKVQKSGAKFDPDKALWINQKHLESLSEAAYLEKAKAYLINNGQRLMVNGQWSIPSEGSKISNHQSTINKLLLLVRDRIKKLSDLYDEVDCIVNPPSDYSTELIQKIKVDPQYLEEFIDIAQENHLNELGQIFKDRIKEKEWPMGNVMKSIRVAIVGNLKGPDLFAMIQILGQEETLKRIDHFKSKL